MRWLKHVLVDLAVTVVIVLATTQDWAWARWLVLIYTPLMLLLKGLALLGGGLVAQVKQPETAVPQGFWHLLYGVNTGVLLVAGWYLTALQWVAIWGLSVAAARRQSSTARPRAKRAA